MAVTAAGTPYVESSDLVANYPGASLSLANRVDQVMQAPTQNAQTGTTYTAVLLDAGKTVTLSNASAVTLTIPAQASVSWADNTQLNFLNLGAGTVTITPAAGVTINGTPLTLATSKGGSLVRTASNVWTFIPFSGGVEAANFTDTATGTYTDGGIDYKYLTLTGTGSVTIDVAGFATLLAVGGAGGAGNDGAGGAGGLLYITSGYFSVGTHTVTIGAGGSGGVSATNGVSTRLIDFYGIGGGKGGYTAAQTAGAGGSGGGGARSSGPGGTGIPGQGYDGGSDSGAGGGSAGVGGSSSGVGGLGTSNAINNAATYYAAGGNTQVGQSTAAGQTAQGSAGAANSGSGGGKPFYAGGSGILILRVVV